MFKNAYPNTAYINLITDDLPLISQIKWRIYGQNFTKQHFEKFLKENKEAIKKLGKEKISKLLKENKIDLKMTIENYTDKLINELIEKNYVQIFL